ncbi:AAA family ATPase [Streptantibioticus parmotrematis]|uniref:helix-turn-helix transcriptional regulator n=1 Tax=Streptantibioticus parmotrematis TaxID=2873249 RepID=UPI0033E5581D
MSGRRRTADAHGLVGRGSELRRLQRAFACLGEGRSVLMEITGEPGMGKTRLLDELARIARCGGATVVAGRCSEYERARPFSAFAAFLDGEASPPPPGSLPGLERGRFHREMAERLGGLGGGGPVVVVLDDLHWADNGSLELLRHILRGTPARPLMIAVAHRPRQTGELLVDALAGACAAFHRERIVPRPLSEEDVAALARSLGAFCPPGLHARCEGNPLYARALMTAGPEGLRAADGHGDPDGPPGDVADAVAQVLLAEARALDPAPLAVLRTAAVVGDPFDPEFVSGLAHAEAPDAAALLDGLRERDLVRPEPSGGRLLCFRHPVLRHAVYQDAGPGWRLVTHRRIAAALAERGAPATALAPHVARSAAPGDREAAAVLVRAARSVLTSVPASAAHWLSRALPLLPEEESEARCELSLLLAHACAAAGDLERGRRILHDLLAALPSDSPHRAAALRLLSLVDRMQGKYEEGAAVLHEESRRGGPDLPSVLALRASCEVLAGRHQAVGHVRRAVRAAADGSVADEARLLALGTRALVEACRGSVPHALEAARQATGLLSGRSDEELAPLLDCLGQLGWAQVLLEQPERASEHFTRGLRAAERTGQSHLSTYLLVGQILAVLRLGDVRAALRAADEAEERSRLLRSDPMLAFALSMRAGALLWRDGPAGAAPVAEQAVRLGGRGRGWWTGVARRILARVRLLEGDALEALRILDDAGGGPGMPGVDVCALPMWLAVQAEALMLLGRPHEAEPLVREALTRAAAVALPAQRGHALAARAELLLRTGDPVGAASVARWAAATFERCGQPLEEARCRLLAAEARAASGRVGAARTELSRAWSIGDAGGARSLADRAAYRYGQLSPSGTPGVRPPAAATPPGERARPAGLTHREHDVVTLVRSGLTNAQVADRLHVTVKAVEAHLTRAYRKLGVTSRSALVAMGTHEISGDGTTTAPGAARMP